MDKGSLVEALRKLKGSVEVRSKGEAVRSRKRIKRGVDKINGNAA